MGKFDARSNDVIFLGYYLHSLAYRVFNKRLIKIEKSIHISFDENRNGNDALVDPEEEELFSKWMNPWVLLTLFMIMLLYIPVGTTSLTLLQVLKKLQKLRMINR